MTDDYPIPSSIRVEGRSLTAPVYPVVQHALVEWEMTQTDEIAKALAPFGLSPYAITAVEYRRVVTPDEVRGAESDDEIVAALRAAGVEFVTPSMVAAVRDLASSGEVRRG